MYKKQQHFSSVEVWCNTNVGLDMRNCCSVMFICQQSLALAKK
jgi:hypothetical protein